LFNVIYIKPSEGVYFYFLIDFDDNDGDFKKKLEAAIRLIRDEGIGGKKTSGAGLFESVKIDDATIFDSLNSNSSKFMSLSLTLPKEDKNEFEKCEAYHLIDRRGYVYHPTQTTKRKKSMRMLSEGSIFSEKVEGDVVDVSPEKGYEVYRFGKFLGIPIKIKENENGMG
jgi:CRISPR-associated protein Csm4